MVLAIFRPSTWFRGEVHEESSEGTSDDWDMSVGEREDAQRREALIECIEFYLPEVGALLQQNPDVLPCRDSCPVYEDDPEGVFCESRKVMMWRLRPLKRPVWIDGDGTTYYREKRHYDDWLDWWVPSRCVRAYVTARPTLEGLQNVLDALMAVRSNCIDDAVTSQVNA